MAEKIYTLAKADLLQKSNPEFVKAARQESKPNPENLEKRRLDFQQEYMILQALIGRIQELNAAAHKTTEPAAKAGIEQQIAAFSNMANLKGLAGLYEGFALLADMLSIRVVKRDDRDKIVLTPDGQKIFIRVPILYDLGADLEELCDNTRRTQKTLFKMALKANAVHVSQAGVDPDVVEVQPATETLKEEAPAGVPESDLKAAQAAPTAEQVEKFVKGDAK